MKNQELRQYKVRTTDILMKILWICKLVHGKFQNYSCLCHNYLGKSCIYSSDAGISKIFWGLLLKMAIKTFGMFLMSCGAVNLWFVQENLLLRNKVEKNYLAHSLLEMVDQRREGLFGIKSAYDHSLRTDVPLRCLHWVVQTSASVIYVYLLMMNSVAWSVTLARVSQNHTP